MLYVAHLRAGVSIYSFLLQYLKQGFACLGTQQIVREGINDENVLIITLIFCLILK